MNEAHARAHPSQQPQQPEEKPLEPEKKKEEKTQKQSHAADESPPDGIFSSLFRDKDKTIILALMLLLADENGDNSLLFALMYLLMD